MIRDCPVSMGSNINSSGFEISPFLSDNDDTLYFASNGFEVMVMRIFFMHYEMEKDGILVNPVNLGEVINSPKFDAYFTIFDHFFYWSSNRDAQMSDIYYSSFKPIPPCMHLPWVQMLLYIKVQMVKLI